MFTLIVLAALAQPPAAEVSPAVGLPPVQGLASIDAKGKLTLWRVTPGCFGMAIQEVPLAPSEKRDKDEAAATAKVTNVMLTIVEVPSKNVEAYTVDGKKVAVDKLAELLAKERAVLFSVDGKKVDPFHLQLYKEGTIVLVPPANVWGMEFGQGGILAIPADATPPPPEIKPPPGGDRLPPLRIPLPGDKGEIRPKPPSPFFNSLALVSAPASADGEKKDDKADAPSPSSVAGILAVRDKLPRGSAPVVAEVEMKDGMIEVGRQVMRLVPRAEEVAVPTADGRVQKVVRTTTVQVVQIEKQAVEAKTLKAFTVTKDGKLEALDAEKLPDRLKKPTTVLLGDSADLDSHHLELIKPGTIYLSIPPQPPVPLPESRKPQ